MSTITEAELRKLVREELGSGVRPAQQSQVGTRIDISSLHDQISDMSHKASAILKDSLGIEIDDTEWNRLGIPNRLANKIVKLLRTEMTSMSEEWQGESTWENPTTKQAV